MTAEASHQLSDRVSGAGSARAAVRRFARQLRRLWAEESGQGTVEYILILSVTVVAAGALSRQILKALDSGIVRLGGQLEKDLKTGRAPLDIWEN